MSNLTTTHCDLFSRYWQLNRLEHIQKKLTGMPSEELFPSETNSALIVLIKAVQTKAISGERRFFMSGKEMKQSSKLRSSNQFVDPEGFIRVGGRIVLSNLTS